MSFAVPIAEPAGGLPTFGLHYRVATTGAYLANSIDSRDRLVYDLYEAQQSNSREAAVPSKRRNKELRVSWLEALRIKSTHPRSPSLSSSLCSCGVAELYDHFTLIICKADEYL